MEFTSAWIITSFIIAAGGFFSIIYSFMILFSIRSKKRINYLHAAMFFLYGFNVLCDSQYRFGTEFIALTCSI